MKFSFVKIVSFETLQFLLFKFTYLIYFDSAKQLYIDLNVFKCFDFDVMIYHIKKEITVKEKNHTVMKKNNTTTTYSFRSSIQFIMFLSRLLKFTEMHY